MRVILLFFLASALLGGCMTPVIFVSPDIDCSKMIPPQIADDVEGAPRPDGTAGDESRFGDEQTGQLDQANAEKRMVSAIYAGCDAAEREIAEKLRPRTALERMTPWRE